MKKTLMLLFFLSLALASPASAGLVLSVGNGDTSGNNPQVVTQGQVVRLPVVLARTGDPFDLSGFILAFELSSLGTPSPGLPVGVRSVGAESYSSIFTRDLGTIEFPFPGSNFDFLVTASTPVGITDPLDSPVRLFDVAIDTGTMATGLYRLNFIPSATFALGPLPYSTFSGNGDHGSITFSQGSFEVRAVPEPSSMAVLGAGLVGLMAAKRRRMRLSHKSTVGSV